MKTVNRNLETPIMFASETHRFWAKWLSWAEYWYSTSNLSMSQMALVKVLYGRDPTHLVQYGQSSTLVFFVE
ncbi:hypothetical protein MA16_Dca028718 [Dendrobium catenatum]|uniref:Uncharacterized protein n=1 Tax=Dendrobium catenatum TaxID=906689 RepID=A0A2I0V888_9ASPA|nr:hypothetical protein MA16_Dca028718 [Dendrobium catenatum]